MKKTTVVIIVLSVSLFAFTQYFFLDKLSESKEQEMLGVYQRGYDTGIMDAFNTIFDKTENCQITSISIDNATKNIVDITCLELQSEVP